MFCSLTMDGLSSLRAKWGAHKMTGDCYRYHEPLVKMTNFTAALLLISVAYKEKEEPQLK